MQALQQAWYSGARWTCCLLPLAALYGLAVWLRRLAYDWNLLPQHKMAVPVIVVGNLTVGGSGKTPLVVWLVARLQEAGWRPGIVSRGYGGAAEKWPQPVSADSDPQQVGDEPVMLAQATGCPVAVAPRRHAAAQLLLEQGANIIVADDGLQHYALARDIEIAVRDGKRGYGNGRLLPAGPLREPLRRLRTVDIEIVHGRGRDFTQELDDPQRLDQAAPPKWLGHFAGQTVHAVAGIGYPQRFFDALIAAGLEVIPHAFADHHQFSAADISFGDDLPVFMTAKDAVKCRAHAGPKHWCVPATARVNADAVRRLDRLIAALPGPAS